MTLTLSLPPELEQYLIQEAQQQGLSVETYVVQLIQKSIFMTQQEKVKDFADRFRKFYYSRLLLCKKCHDILLNYFNSSQPEISLVSDMNPLNYHPFSGSYFRESYVLSCSLIDSLSSLEIKLKSPERKENRNEIRFTSFLLTVFKEEENRNYLDSVSIPFLSMEIDNLFKKIVKNIEKQSNKPKEENKDEENKKEQLVNLINQLSEKFKCKIKKTWLNDSSSINRLYKWDDDKHPEENRSYRVHKDPKIDDCMKLLEEIWLDITGENIKNDKCLYGNFIKEFEKYRYCNLIYKKYRCAFIHEYKPDENTTFFNLKNDGISIRFYGDKPYIDIGFGLLLDAIEKGTERIYGLILKKDLEQLKDIWTNL
jgi:hypothetical protein